MEIMGEEHASVDSTCGGDSKCPPTHFLVAPGGSSSSDVRAATLHDGTDAEDSTLCEARKQQSEGGDLTGHHAQDMYSDSDYSGLDTDEEDMVKLGDGIWVHEKYLAYLREPKDMDIILFCRGDPGTWMAVAPEWQVALGFGASIEEASADLQSKLVETKLMFIERKMGDFIKKIPMAPRGKRARQIRDGLCNGYYDEEEKAYFDERANDSSAVVWRTIKV